MNKWVKYLGILSGVILLILYLNIPEFKENIQYVFMLLKESNIDGLREYIISYDIVGPLVSILIMILQAVIAPLPAFIITFVNAYIYGLAFGMIISCIGTYLGASLCFFLSKIYGRPMAEKFIPKNILDKCDFAFKKYGKHVLYASRLLPFVSFDGVSYAAGLTTMSFKYFSIATIIGQIPLTFVISVLGKNLDNPKVFVSQAILCAILALIAMIVIYIVYRKRYNGKPIRVILRNLTKNK